MTEAETEARMREILGPGWKAPRTEHDRYNYAALRDEGDVPWIAKVGSFWQFAGAHPALRGECTVSADVDGIVLAERLASLVGPEQQAIAETEALFAEGEIEDYTLDPPALEGAAPADADFSEPGEDDSPTYVFGDNLGNDRLVRIGQITEYADALIADVWAAANAQPDEHSTARAHVVTHLNASGAYVGPSPEIFSRFVELETANAKVSAINTAKADKIAFIRVANHAQVEAFDVEADWP